jgi:ACT domain-containing protein
MDRTIGLSDLLLPIRYYDFWKTYTVEGNVYIEGISFPASYSIIVLSNNIFNGWRNIGCAVADIVIYPPSTRGILGNEEINFAKDLINILQLNPIVVITEKYKTENPPSDFYLYNDDEIIKFIGVAYDVVTDLTAGRTDNFSIQVRFKAVDLMSYALWTTKIYALGNKLSVSYASAYSITPQQFLTAILSQLLEENTNVSDVISYLISLIGTYPVPTTTEETRVNEVGYQTEKVEIGEKDCVSIWNEFIENPSGAISKMEFYLANVIEAIINKSREEEAKEIVKKFTQYFFYKIKGVNVPSVLLRNLYKVYWGSKEEVEELKEIFKRETSQTILKMLEFTSKMKENKIDEIQVLMNSVENKGKSILNEIKTSDISKDSYQKLKQKLGNNEEKTDILLLTLLYAESSFNTDSFNELSSDGYGSIGPFQTRVYDIIEQNADPDLVEKLYEETGIKKENKKDLLKEVSECLGGYKNGNPTKGKYINIKKGCSGSNSNIFVNCSDSDKKCVKIINAIINYYSYTENRQKYYNYSIKYLAQKLDKNCKFNNDWLQNKRDVINEAFKEVGLEESEARKYYDIAFILDCWRGSQKQETLVTEDKERYKKLANVVKVKQLEENGINSEILQNIKSLNSVVQQIQDQQKRVDIINKLVGKAFEDIWSEFQKKVEKLKSENKVKASYDVLEILNKKFKDGVEVKTEYIDSETQTTKTLTEIIPSLQLKVLDFWSCSNLRNLLVNGVLLPKKTSLYFFNYFMLQRGFNILPADRLLTLGDVLDIFLSFLRYRMIFVYPFRCSIDGRERIIFNAVVPDLTYSSIILKDNLFDPQKITFGDYNIVNYLKSIISQYKVVDYHYQFNNFVLETLSNLFKFETNIQKPTSIVISMLLNNEPILAALPFSRMDKIIKDLLNTNKELSDLDINYSFFLSDTKLEKIIPRNIFVNNQELSADPILNALWSNTDNLDLIVPFSWGLWVYLRQAYEFYRHWSNVLTNINIPYNPFILSGLPSFFLTSNLGSFGGIIESVSNYYSVDRGFITNISYSVLNGNSIFVPILKVLDEDVVKFFEGQSKGILVDFQFAPVDYDYLKKLELLLSSAYLVERNPQIEAKKVGFLILKKIEENFVNGRIVSYKMKVSHIYKGTEYYYKDLDFVIGFRRRIKELLFNVASYTESVAVAFPVFSALKSQVEEGIPIEEISLENFTNITEFIKFKYSFFLPSTQ